MNQSKPWDARLAYRLVFVLKDKDISPNVLTTVRLAVGLLSAWCFAFTPWMNAAALLFALSHFLDHTDGELARLTGKTSRAGHFYDLASDAAVIILLFVSVAFGLARTGFGWWSLPLGAIAGCSVATIFHYRNVMENALGKTATRQASFAGFEVEDVLYLLPLVTLLDGLAPFLIASAVGAPIAATLVVHRYRTLTIP